MESYLSVATVMHVEWFPVNQDIWGVILIRNVIDLLSWKYKSWRHFLDSSYNCEKIYFWSLNKFLSTFLLIIPILLFEIWNLFTKLVIFCSRKSKSKLKTNKSSSPRLTLRHDPFELGEIYFAISSVLLLFHLSSLPVLIYLLLVAASSCLFSNEIYLSPYCIILDLQLRSKLCTTFRNFLCCPFWEMLNLKTRYAQVLLNNFFKSRFSC